MDSVKLIVPDKGGNKEGTKQCYSKNFILLLVIAFCFLTTLFYILFPGPLDFVSETVMAADATIAVSIASNEGNASQIADATSVNQNGSLNQQYRDVERHYTTNEIIEKQKYTFEDLDQFLCAKESEPPNNTHTILKRPCPDNGIVTAVAGGRTGNQMWVYASIWALAKKTGLEPFVPTCIKWKLEVMFDSLSLPTLKAISHCPFDFNSSVSSVGIMNKHSSLIVPRFSFHISDALPWMKQILKEFNFRKELKDNAQQILHGFVAQLSPRNYTFVAVHVRRADYIKYVERRFQRKPVTEQFFLNAMAYYREHFSNCVFVYISDDPQWCFNHFGNWSDVFVASNNNNTVEEDLAVMQACNHSIFDYGTFGEWGSILAGGHTVASRTQIIHESTRKWGHWTLVDDIST